MSYEEMLNKLIEESEKAAKKLLEKTSRGITVIHHDDADGVAACALLKLALEDEYRVSTICLEKVYPQAVKKIQDSGDEPIIYVDLGAPHLHVIASLNPRKRDIVILDHHDIEGTRFSDEYVALLNPEVYGVSGEVYACGASLAYVFTRSIGKDLSRYAHLAVIGSVEIPGEVKGLNLLALESAVRAGVATYDKLSGKRSVLWDGRFVNPESLSTKLTILASVGYYEEGPKKALEACIKSSWAEIGDYLNRLEEKRRKAYSNVIAKLRYEGLEKLKRVQWFHVKDEFRDMGTKVIGTFCSYLMHQKLVDDDKILVGVMNMRREIPGIGNLDEDYVKVSARAPRRVLSLIELGALEPLSKALPEAAKSVGGFGDGHAAAASGIIPKGKEREFIELMDKIITKGAEELKKGSLTLERFLFFEKVKK
ncbi:MAG: DHH family phosphoesterase [Nitrososphaerota archaeon]|nr:DHH family phosphoesterase [Candidatus Nezhaarchaeota archaeon]MDW8050174.1 DHH family phosphoesterase [Nitrososphaerota archaeon]